MQYPELVWTVLVIIGGYLLINKASLTKKNKWGIGLIFVGFLFQVYWVITHPWVDKNSLAQIIFVTIWLLITLPLLVWPGWLRKRISKQNSK